NPAVLWTAGLTAASVWLLVGVAPVRDAFHMGPVTGAQVVVAVAAATVGVSWFEVSKLVGHRSRGSSRGVTPP
ncbi:MAG: hypothetical protein ACO36A_04520, partial [Ilumatobacteraceae bacterium]